MFLLSNTTKSCSGNKVVYNGNTWVLRNTTVLQSRPWPRKLHQARLCWLWHCFGPFFKYFVTTNNNINIKTCISGARSLLRRSRVQVRPVALSHVSFPISLFRLSLSSETQKGQKNKQTCISLNWELWKSCFGTLALDLFVCHHFITLWLCTHIGAF